MRTWASDAGAVIALASWYSADVGHRGNQTVPPRLQFATDLPVGDRTIVGLAATGIEKLNVAPGESFGVAQRCPLWLLMIERQIDRPMPMPFALVV